MSSDTDITPPVNKSRAALIANTIIDSNVPSKATSFAKSIGPELKSIKDSTGAYLMEVNKSMKMSSDTEITPPVNRSRAASIANTIADSDATSKATSFAKSIGPDLKSLTNSYLAHITSPERLGRVTKALSNPCELVNTLCGSGSPKASPKRLQNKSNPITSTPVPSSSKLNHPPLQPPRPLICFPLPPPPQCTGISPPRMVYCPASLPFAPAPPPPPPPPVFAQPPPPPMVVQPLPIPVPIMQPCVPQMCLPPCPPLCIPLPTCPPRKSKSDSNASKKKKKKKNPRPKRISKKCKCRCVADSDEDQEKSWSHPSIRRKKWWLQPLWKADERRRSVPKFDDPFRHVKKEYGQGQDDFRNGSVTMASFPNENQLPLQHMSSSKNRKYSHLDDSAQSRDPSSFYSPRRVYWPGSSQDNLAPLQTTVSNKPHTDVNETEKLHQCVQTDHEQTKSCFAAYSSSENKTVEYGSSGERKVITQIDTTTVMRRVFVEVTRKKKHSRGKTLKISLNLGNNGGTQVNVRPEITASAITGKQDKLTGSDSIIRCHNTEGELRLPLFDCRDRRYSPPSSTNSPCLSRPKRMFTRNVDSHDFKKSKMPVECQSHEISQCQSPISDGTYPGQSTGSVVQTPDVAQTPEAAFNDDHARNADPTAFDPPAMLMSSLKHRRQTPYYNTDGGQLLSPLTSSQPKDTTKSRRCLPCEGEYEKHSSPCNVLNPSESISSSCKCSETDQERGNSEHSCEMCHYGCEQKQLKTICKNHENVCEQLGEQCTACKQRACIATTELCEKRELRPDPNIELSKCCKSCQHRKGYLCSQCLESEEKSTSSSPSVGSCHCSSSSQRQPSGEDLTNQIFTVSPSCDTDQSTTAEIENIDKDEINDGQDAQIFESPITLQLRKKALKGSQSPNSPSRISKRLKHRKGKNITFNSCSEIQDQTQHSTSTETNLSESNASRCREQNAESERYLSPTVLSSGCQQNVDYKTCMGQKKHDEEKETSTRTMPPLENYHVFSALFSAGLTATHQTDADKCKVNNLSSSSNSLDIVDTRINNNGKNSLPREKQCDNSEPGNVLFRPASPFKRNARNVINCESDSPNSVKDEQGWTRCTRQRSAKQKSRPRQSFCNQECVNEPENKLPSSKRANATSVSREGKSQCIIPSNEEQISQSQPTVLDSIEDKISAKINETYQVKPCKQAGKQTDDDDCSSSTPVSVLSYSISKEKCQQQKYPHCNRRCCPRSPTRSLETVKDKPECSDKVGDTMCPSEQPNDPDTKLGKLPIRKTPQHKYPQCSRRCCQRSQPANANTEKDTCTCPDKSEGDLCSSKQPSGFASKASSRRSGRDSENSCTDKGNDFIPSKETKQCSPKSGQSPNSERSTQVTNYHNRCLPSFCPDSPDHEVSPSQQLSDSCSKSKTEQSKKAPSQDVYRKSNCSTFLSASPKASESNCPNSRSNSLCFSKKLNETNPKSKQPLCNPSTDAQRRHSRLSPALKSPCLHQKITSGDEHEVCRKKESLCVPGNCSSGQLESKCPNDETNCDPFQQSSAKMECQNSKTVESQNCDRSHLESDNSSRKRLNERRASDKEKCSIITGRYFKENSCASNQNGTNSDITEDIYEYHPDSIELDCETSDIDTNKIYYDCHQLEEKRHTNEKLDQCGTNEKPSKESSYEPQKPSSKFRSVEKQSECREDNFKDVISDNEHEESSSISDCIPSEKEHVTLDSCPQDKYVNSSETSKNHDRKNHDQQEKTMLKKPCLECSENEGKCPFTKQTGFKGARCEPCKPPHYHQSSRKISPSTVSVTSRSVEIPCVPFSTGGPGNEDIPSGTKEVPCGSPRGLGNQSCPFRSPESRSNNEPCGPSIPCDGDDVGPWDPSSQSCPVPSKPKSRLKDDILGPCVSNEQSCTYVRSKTKLKDNSIRPCDPSSQSCPLRSKLRSKDPYDSTDQSSPYVSSKSKPRDDCLRPCDPSKQSCPMRSKVKSRSKDNLSGPCDSSSQSYLCVSPKSRPHAKNYSSGPCDSSSQACLKTSKPKLKDEPCGPCVSNDRYCPYLSPKSRTKDDFCGPCNPPNQSCAMQSKAKSKDGPCELCDTGDQGCPNRSPKSRPIMAPCQDQSSTNCPCMHRSKQTHSKQCDPRCGSGPCHPCTNKDGEYERCAPRPHCGSQKAVCFPSNSRKVFQEQIGCDSCYQTKKEIIKHAIICPIAKTDCKSCSCNKRCCSSTRTELQNPSFCQKPKVSVCPETQCSACIQQFQCTAFEERGTCSSKDCHEKRPRCEKCHKVKSRKRKARCELKVECGSTFDPIKPACTRCLRGCCRSNVVSGSCADPIKTTCTRCHGGCYESIAAFGSSVDPIKPACTRCHGRCCFSSTCDQLVSRSCQTIRISKSDHACEIGRCSKKKRKGRKCKKERTTCSSASESENSYTKHCDEKCASSKRQCQEHRSISSFANYMQTLTNAGKNTSFPGCRTTSLDSCPNASLVNKRNTCKIKPCETLSNESKLTCPSGTCPPIRNPPYLSSLRSIPNMPSKDFADISERIACLEECFKTKGEPNHFYSSLLSQQRKLQEVEKEIDHYLLEDFCFGRKDNQLLSLRSPCTISNCKQNGHGKLLAKESRSEECNIYNYPSSLKRLKFDNNDRQKGIHISDTSNVSELTLSYKRHEDSSRERKNTYSCKQDKQDVCSRSYKTEHLVAGKNTPEICSSSCPRSKTSYWSSRLPSRFTLRSRSSSLMSRSTTNQTKTISCCNDLKSTNPKYSKACISYPSKVFTKASSRTAFCLKSKRSIEQRKTSCVFPETPTYLSPSCFNQPWLKKWVSRGGKQYKFVHIKAGLPCGQTDFDFKKSVCVSPTLNKKITNLNKHLTKDVKEPIVRLKGDAGIESSTQSEGPPQEHKETLENKSPESNPPPAQSTQSKKEEQKAKKKNKNPDNLKPIEE